MKSQNDLTRETVSGNVVILDFNAQYADDVLDIQAECGLSFWSKNDYLGELERADSIFKIALSPDGKIIGFALMHLLVGANDQNDSAIAEFSSSEILNIAVRNLFQHKSIGANDF